MTVNEENIFYLDASGAVLSIFLLGFFLPYFQVWHGMPFSTLYGLCLWACICLAYNVSCLFFGDRRNSKWLVGIMLLNVAYCIINLVLVIVHFAELTKIGLFYFMSELPVILALVVFERKIYHKAFSKVSEESKH